MHYGVKLEDFGERWREAMREWTGGYSARTEDDAAEQAFWKGFMKERSFRAPDSYSQPIWEEVKRLVEGAGVKDILEIGPGWGNYTFRLASCCERLECVDLSEDVLDFIRREGRRLGYEIRIRQVKWEAYEGAGSDLIFGYNCFYRMKEIEHSLRKINQKARRLCVIGMTSGPEQPYFKEMERTLGVAVKYHRLDYIYLVNILYQLGIDCNVKILPLTKTYRFSSLEEAARKESSRILKGTYDLDAVKGILKKYLKQSPDGSWTYEHHHNGAVIWWTPVCMESMDS